MWPVSNFFSLALAEVLVLLATSHWPPLHQTLAVCATFLGFLVTHYDGE